MKYYFSLLSIFIVLSSFTQAQESNVLPGLTNITIDAITQEGKLTLKSQYLDEDDFITITSPLLIDADILITFDIQLPKDAAYCRLRLELFNENGKTIAHSSKEVYLSVKKTITLYDITEEGLYLNEQYTLVIQHDLIGNKPCEAKRPIVDWKQKKWPVLTTSLGLIGLGISEIGLKTKQQSKYSDYIDLWESGAFEADAEPFRQDAEDTRDIRRVVTTGSGLLVAGGVIWWIIKKRNINKRQKQFDRYCKPISNLNITPDFSYQSNNTALGLKLSYQF